MSGQTPEEQDPRVPRVDLEAGVLPLFDLFPDAIAILDSDAIITRVNRVFTELLGYAQEEIQGSSLELIVPDDLRDEFFSHKRDVLKGDRIGRDTVRRAKDGTLIDVLARGLPIELGDGTKMILAVYTDIRKRKEAERSLQRERDRTQRYLDTAAVMLLALDGDGTITLINNKGCQILDCPQEEVLGKNWFTSFLPEEDRDRVLAFFKGMISGEIDLVEHYENSVITSSGEERLISWHNTFFRDESGSIIGTLSSGEDITEKKLLEEQLLESRKLESAGRLAGAVAHDFNNLLTVISGTAEILSLTGDIAEDSQTYVRLNRIKEAAGKAAVLIDKLTSYGRQQLLQPRVFDLNNTVSGLEKLLRQTLRENIEISISPADGPAMIKVDPTHMERVILDLAINAGESMPEGGILSITIEAADINSDQITAERLMIQPGRYITFCMSDTGDPIPAEDLPHIFEPRLTSREVGRESGYILPGVFGYVKQSGGEMSVSSGPDRGSTFRIYFPEQEAGTEPAPAASRKKKIGGTGGTILVVDDEPEIREMITIILDTLGYQVLAAGSGQEALEIIGAEHVDLLITDTIMPGMGGVELARQIVERGKAVNVIFVSGYPGQEVIEREGLTPDSAFLQKPFTVSGLTELVQQFL